MRESADDFDSHSYGYSTRLAATEEPEDLPRKQQPKHYEPRIYNPSAGDSPPDDLDKPHTGKPSP